jgi:hypothetical protein
VTARPKHAERVAQEPMLLPSARDHRRNAQNTSKSPAGRPPSTPDRCTYDLKVIELQPVFAHRREDFIARSVPCPWLAAFRRLAAFRTNSVNDREGSAMEVRGRDGAGDRRTSEFGQFESIGRRFLMTKLADNAPDMMRARRPVIWCGADVRMSREASWAR